MVEWWEKVKWENVNQVIEAHQRGKPDRAHLGLGAYLPFHNALQIIGEMTTLSDEEICNLLFKPMKISELNE